MPRFYLDLADGTFEQDMVGEEFPDLAAASRAAIGKAARLLKDLDPDHPGHVDPRIEVRDHKRMLLRVVRIKQLDAPDPADAG